MSMFAYPLEPAQSSGLWKIQFQRSYWYDSLNDLYRKTRGTGEYGVFKVQVGTAKNYIFTTSSNSSSYDTYLSLYDHNFNEIAYNDNYNGV